MFFPVFQPFTCHFLSDATIFQEVLFDVIKVLFYQVICLSNEDNGNVGYCFVRAFFYGGSVISWVVLSGAYFMGLLMLFALFVPLLQVAHAPDNPCNLPTIRGN